MTTIPPTEESVNAASTAGGLEGEVQSALASADATATSRIQTLSLVQQARTSRLTRSAANATAQYGAESAQAKAAQAAVTASNATNARVLIAKQQLATPAPPVSATGWALHGRVFDAQLQPLADHTVFLADPQNSYQSAYGFAYTDNTGYFLLGSESAPSTEGQNGAAQAQSPQLFVSIVNPDAQPVYVGKTAFEPSIGRATYQEIALPGGAKPIGDPPAAVRSTGFPPPQRKRK
jgi:hypothetical protein